MVLSVNSSASDPGSKKAGGPSQSQKTQSRKQPRSDRTPQNPHNLRHSRRRAPRPFSPQQLATRAALLPAISFPEDLPVSARRDQIAETIRDHQVTIVCGETGSGKTTQIPKICLQLGRGISAMIGHTQPRRIAARAVADRIASELGSKVSSDADSIVGYQVRFTDEVGPSTLVKLMTDGILLAEIQNDPQLRRYDTIIIDEAHERSLNIDFLLGYLKQLLPRRPDLKLIITSATIDAQRFSEHFCDEDGRPAPVVEVSGRTFPVEIRYRPLSADLSSARGVVDSSGQATTPPQIVNSDNSSLGLVLENLDDDLPSLGYGLGEDIDYFTAICHATDELCAEGEGDILVFLPGERDIRDANEALRDHLGSRYLAPGTATAKSPLDGIEVMPLYSRLSAAEQQRIFQSHPRRRVVLATNVAETSLTVPGIRYVIDPGLARISRYSNRTKVQRLPIEPISQASANQRSGRCGRVDDGVAIRLYSPADFSHRPQYTEPEILRTSLASVILQMISLGLGQVEDFPFLDAPAAAAIRQGIAVLDEIGAIAPRRHEDDRLRLTRVGWDLAKLPIDPRLGRMLVESKRHGCASEVIVIVAALSMQDVRERPEAFQGDADAAHARFLDPTSDFITYLTLWRYLRLVSREMSNSAMRRLCKREFLHYLRWREWQDVVAQLTELSIPLRLEVRPLELPSRADITFQTRTAGPDGALARAAVETTKRTCGANADAIHRSLLVGLLSNLGWWDPQRNVYEGARAAKFVIWPGSGLARKHYDWVMAAELVETSRLFARTVAKIDPEWVEPLARRFVKRSYSQPYWSTRRGAAMVREKVTLHGLTLIADRPVLLANLPADVRVEGVGAGATSVAARTFGATQVGGSLSEMARKTPPSSSPGEAAGSEGRGGKRGRRENSNENPAALELARDMFIRHALINEEWDANYGFIANNRTVLADIRESEQKLRTGGAVSEDTLFSFYDERLPDFVVSQQSFDSWWRRTKHRGALTLTREALLPEGQAWDPNGFPSHWEQADLELPLEYEFTPGAARDGLNVRVPLSVLARVEDRGFEWLVPGMLEGLVTATIRALPKQLRAQLVPAPQVGGELAAWIRTHVWGQVLGDEAGAGFDDSTGVCASNRGNLASDSSTSSPHSAAAAGGETHQRRASGAGSDSEPQVDPRSLEASLGRLAAWAQKSGAASAKSVAKMQAASKPQTQSHSPASAATSSTNGVEPSTSTPTASDAAKRVEPTTSMPTASDAANRTGLASDTTDLTPDSPRPTSGTDRAPDSPRPASGTDLANRPTQPRLPGTRQGSQLPHFFDAFRDAARTLRGVDIPADLWENLDLPTHATATFVVVDDRGREVRSAPSLTFLQKQLGTQAQLAVRSAMRDALQQALRDEGRKGRVKGMKAFRGVEVGSAPGKADELSAADHAHPTKARQRRNSARPDDEKSGVDVPEVAATSTPGEPTSNSKPRPTPSETAQTEADDLTDWPDENYLPPMVETTTRSGLVVRGYPSLTPQGSFLTPSAGVRIHAEEATARRDHPRGLARLLVNRVGLSQTRISTRWSGREALLLASGPYPNTDELIAQAQYASALSLVDEFHVPAQQVRDRAAFDDLAGWVRDRHEDRVYQIIGYAVAAFAAGADLDRALRKVGAPSLLRVMQDVRAHSQALLSPSMLADFPLRWLPHVERFLRADELRLRKAAESAVALSRDEGLAREVAQLRSLLDDEAERVVSADEDAVARLGEARWLLEELRVSLFAQELGTSQKVSVKRIRNLLGK